MRTHHKKLIEIVAGPNGSGKTTFARIYFKFRNGASRFINADTIAAGLSGGNEAQAAFHAGRVMLKAIEDALKNDESVFLSTWHNVPKVSDAATLEARFALVREVRASAQKEIELQRADGKLGSSLQAEVDITAEGETFAALAALDDELKFVLITSQARLKAGDATQISVSASTEAKCERCWHWSTAVGMNA